MKEKIKELGKRLLTIAVALAMVVTCMPGTAFGAETSEKVKKNVRVPDTLKTIDQLKPAKAESDERKQLKSLIEKADKLNESDYTAESWAEFKDTRDSIDNVDEIPDQFVGIVL